MQKDNAWNIVNFVNRLQETYINLHEKNKVLNQFMGTFESIANKYSMCELSTVAYKSETQSMQIVQREWQIKCWISIALKHRKPRYFTKNRNREYWKLKIRSSKNLVRKFFFILWPQFFFMTGFCEWNSNLEFCLEVLQNSAVVCFFEKNSQNLD